MEAGILLALRGRHRRERAKGSVLDLPLAPAQLSLRSLAGSDVPSICGPIESLAVDAHAGRYDQPLDRPPEELLDQHARAQVVGADVRLDLVHALADTHGRGEMIDRLDPVQSAPDSLAVAHVASLELHLAAQIGRRLARPSVHLRGQVVEHADLMTRGEELVGKM